MHECNKVCVMANHMPEYEAACAGAGAELYTWCWPARMYALAVHVGGQLEPQHRDGVTGFA